MYCAQTIFHEVIDFSGVMLNSHSPPSSTPLEPCRVVPYMNVPALRGISLTSGSVALSNFERLSTAPFSQQGTAFSAISPAFISAAHQVKHIIYRVFYSLRSTISREGLLFWISTKPAMSNSTKMFSRFQNQKSAMLKFTGKT